MCKKSTWRMCEDLGEQMDKDICGMRDIRAKSKRFIFDVKVLSTKVVVHY